MVLILFGEFQEINKLNQQNDWRFAFNDYFDSFLKNLVNWG